MTPPVLTNLWQIPPVPSRD